VSCPSRILAFIIFCCVLASAQDPATPPVAPATTPPTAQAPAPPNATATPPAVAAPTATETPANEALKPQLDRLKQATDCLDQIKESLNSKQDELLQSPKQKPLFDKLQAEYTDLRRDGEAILKDLTSTPKSNVTARIDKHYAKAQALRDRVSAFSTDSGRLNLAAYTLHQQSDQLTKEVANEQQAPNRTLLKELLAQTSAAEQDAAKISEKVTAQGNTNGLENAIAELTKRADVINKRSSAFLDAANQFIASKSSLDSLNESITGWEKETQTAKAKANLQKLREGHTVLQKRRTLTDSAIASEKSLTAAQANMQRFSSRVQDFAQKVSLFSSGTQKLAATNSRLEEINQNLSAAEDEANTDGDAARKSEAAHLRAQYASIHEELDQAQQALSAPTPSADLESRIRRITANVDALNQQVSRFLNNGQVIVTADTLIVRARGGQPTSLPITEITELSYGRAALRMIETAESKEKFVRPPTVMVDLFGGPHKHFVGIRSQGSDGQKRMLLIQMPAATYLGLIKQLMAASKAKLLIDSHDASYIPSDLNATIVKPKPPTGKKGSYSSPFGM
jgi:hypothetical protein